MPSRRETLLSNIVTKLEAIKGGAGFDYSSKLESVQRSLHAWDGEENSGNRFGKLPTIIVRVIGETSELNVDQIWTNEIEIDIHFVLDDASGSVEQTSALRDLKKALFSSLETWDCFGVGVTNPRMSNQLVDRETGQPLDGVHLVLTLNYDEQFGDPDSGY